MVNRLEVSSQGEHIEQQEHVGIVETLICLEALLVTCYQSLAGLVHNETIRKECRQFGQHMQYRQEELKNIFPFLQESETAIEDKIIKYLLQFKIPFRSLREVINLAIHLTAFKIDIYRYLSHTAQEDQELLNNFLEDNVEEMDFLCHEKEFHQHRLDAYLKTDPRVPGQPMPTSL